MTQVHLVALKDGSPDGNHRYKKGDRYSIGQRAAELLVKIGWARRVDVKETPKARRDSAKD